MKWLWSPWGSLRPPLARPRGPPSLPCHPGPPARWRGRSRGALLLGRGPSDPPASPQNSSAPLAEDMDPEVRPPTRGASPRCSLALGSDRLSPLQLARYLNRNYWEKKQEEARKSPTPSAPVPLTEPAAQPAEGHAAPASVAEVRGPPAPVHGPPGGPWGRASAAHPLASPRPLSWRQTRSPRRPPAAPSVR